MTLALGAFAEGIWDALAAVESAQTEVLWAGSYLREPLMADALRRKVVQGVRVWLVTSPYTYLDESSYFLSLYLAGAELYLGVPREYLLAVDGAVRFRGRGLGVPGNPIQKVEGEREARRLLAEVLREAQPFGVSPERVALYLLRQVRQSPR